MNNFEKLIRNGWVETDSADDFVLPVGRISWEPSKVSVPEDKNLILLSTKDERFYVEMRQGMTYFYNPIMWRVKELDDDINDINKGWHDDIKLDERSKEILDSIWPVIHGRVMQMIGCGQ